MPGVLIHSPADVIAQMLVAGGVGTDPATNSLWPVYATSEAVLPDNSITVYDTAGLDEGRDHSTLERAVHDGVQVRIRSTTPTVGFTKANVVALYLDAVQSVGVNLDGHRYVVNNVSRTSGVIPLGKDGPLGKRNLFTINALVSLRKIS
jgi:hypothetical protein